MILGNFQKKALGVALLILTFSILIMVYADYKKNKGAAFPPLVNQCPDYFDYVGTTCIDTNKVYGEATAYTIDLSGTIFAPTNANSDCNKKIESKRLGITWDGITNNSSLTC
jgi:hypothetical protein